MKHVRQATLLVTFLLIGAAAGRAQEEAVPGAASTARGKDLVTVYIYRYDSHGNLLFNQALPVSYGEGPPHGVKLRKIAGLRKKRYFTMRLPPGTYSFDTTGMSGKLKLEVAAGGEYYLRLDEGDYCVGENDTFSDKKCEIKKTAIFVETPEQARGHLSGVKPIEPNDVRDRKLVIIP